MTNITHSKIHILLCLLYKPHHAVYETDSSTVGELKNQYLFLFFITRQWHLIGRHHDMVLPWDSGLIPRGMSQGFVLNMAPVQTHQGLQPECKK